MCVCVVSLCVVCPELRCVSVFVSVVCPEPRCVSVSLCVVCPEPRCVSVSLGRESLCTSPGLGLFMRHAALCSAVCSALLYAVQYSAVQYSM